MRRRTRLVAIMAARRPQTEQTKMNIDKRVWNADGIDTDYAQAAAA